MNLKEIKEMISLMDEHEISEFQLERDGFKVLLKKGISGNVIVERAPASQPAAAPVAAAVPETVPTAAPVAEEGVIEILSPMVGTFYRSSSPEADPHVQLGDSVTEDSVVCILEAMKVMNEIKSEVKGKITEVLVENGEAVEYGQPLFKVKKD